MLSVHFFLRMLLLLCCSLAQAQGAPEVALPAVVEQGQKVLILSGQRLGGLEVRLGVRPLKVLSSSDSSVTLELPPNLPTGEYALSLRTRDGAVSAEQGLLVLPREGFTKGGDPSALEPGRALLLTSPGKFRALEVRWTRAGFALEFRLDPFLPGSAGVCGQVLVGLRDRRESRSTVAGMGALVGALYKEGGFRIAGRLIMRGPAQNGLSAVRRASSADVGSLSTPAAAPRALSVAVLDTGLSNPQNWGAGQVDWGRARSFLDLAYPGGALPDGALERSPSGALQSRENLGHGTAVAARLAGATGAGVLPLQVCDGEGECSTSSLIAGLCYTASLASDPISPVRVLNLSLSGEVHQVLVYEALEEVVRRGVSVVVASGNQRREGSLGQPPSFPAFYSVVYASGVQSWPALPGLIAVGSVNKDNQPSSFSSAGAWVTVSALGENLSLPRADGQGPALFSGTSFAAPLVSAWIAELLARRPNLSPAQVKARLLEAVRPLPGCPLERCGQGRLPEVP